MNHWDSFINNVIAEFFGQTEVEDPSIPAITKPGWYWADRDDNARYSDYTGPFATKGGAIAAGKNFRRNLVKNYTQGTQE